jgi:c-di-GMP-related signal transduction protein
MSNPSAPDTADTANAANESAIARQAIVDDKGQVYGYELFDRSRRFSDHDAASDAQMLFNVLTHADTGALMDKRTMFVNCALDSLASEHLELIKPERVVLEVPHVADHNPAEIGAIAWLSTRPH